MPDDWRRNASRIAGRSIRSLNLVNLNMPKVVPAGNRRRLYEKVKGMQRAGKSDKEISQSLSITPPTIQYLAKLFQKGELIETNKSIGIHEKRPERAHDLWLAGKSYADISELMQISIGRVRQIIHRQAWSLHQPEQRGDKNR